MEKVTKREKKNRAMKQIKKKRQPIEGVTYDRKRGAKCPKCSFFPGYVTNTMKWEDDIRMRYHVCRRCGTRFKSVEVI